jgi:hypothetical protein
VKSSIVRLNSGHLAQQTFSEPHPEALIEAAPIA